MSFQAYIENIREKCGHSPEDFARLAADQGFMVNSTRRKDIKVGPVLEWLHADFGLGRGHGMAIVALPQGRGR